MNRISVVMKMYAKDKPTWFIVPWGVLSLIFILNWIISSLIEQPMYTGGLSYFLIYFMVVGITSLVYTFPFALSFSVRRKDYFIGTIAMIVSVSAFCSIILTLLALVEKSLHGWGTDLHFFALPYLSDGSFLEQLWIYFASLLHLFFLGSVIAGIYLRFSGKGVYVFFTILLLISTVISFLASRNGWWVDMFTWFKVQTAFEVATWMGLVAIIYALATFFLLRKATSQ
jgi:hypothetical protein